MKGYVLVETLYRPQHLNITACCGDKIDYNASTGVAGGDGRGDPVTTISMLLPKYTKNMSHTGARILQQPLANLINVII